MLAGAVSFINSATKLAALVGLVGLGLLSSCDEVEDASDHAWRNGDGLNGAVCLAGVRRRDGSGEVWRKTPFVRGVEGVMLGKGTPLLVGVGDGSLTDAPSTFLRLASWPETLGRSALS